MGGNVIKLLKRGT